MRVPTRRARARNAWITAVFALLVAGCSIPDSANIVVRDGASIDAPAPDGPADDTGIRDARLDAPGTDVTRDAHVADIPVIDASDVPPPRDVAPPVDTPPPDDTPPPPDAPPPVDACVVTSSVDVCDGVDNDCDGFTDENPDLHFYIDSDGDSYGNPNNSMTTCTMPAGYVGDDTDCDDRFSNVHPRAPEMCDSLDNNCNGLTDEGTNVTTFYRDYDRDGYGSMNAAMTVTNCAMPSGYVGNADDCNDFTASIHPGAVETCDGIDDDCDTMLDEYDANCTGLYCATMDHGCCDTLATGTCGSSADYCSAISYVCIPLGSGQLQCCEH